MRYAVLALMVLLAAPLMAQDRKTAPGNSGGPKREAPAEPVARGWETDLDAFAVTFADADRRAGYRPDLQARGCDRGADVSCQFMLRGLRVTARAPAPAERVSAVEIEMNGETRVAMAFAAFHALTQWAEPTATREQRVQAADAILRSDPATRPSTTIGRTRISMRMEMRGVRVVAVPH
jgi:hypothetical protein